MDRLPRRPRPWACPDLRSTAGWRSTGSGAMPSKPTTCRDCGMGITQPIRAKRLRCDPCGLKRNRRLAHERWSAANPSSQQHAPASCVRCGTSMDGGRWNQRQFCRACRKTRNKELGREAYERHPDKRRAAGLRWRLAQKPSINVRYATCLNCREVLVLHGNADLCRREECKTIENRLRMREYMRRTHYMAAKYWRIADTPEAKELAHTYDQLRRLLRSKTSGERI